MTDAVEQIMQRLRQGNRPAVQFDEERTRELHERSLELLNKKEEQDDE